MATNMDLADKIELDSLIHFPGTKSTWKITSRLSPYPVPDQEGGSDMPTSDSFAHSYAFAVEICASGEKVVPAGVPKYAIVRIKCREASRNSTEPGDVIDPALLAELRALEQSTLNHCQYTPRLLDAKVELHLTSCRHLGVNNPHQEGETKHYVTYILVTLLPGTPLTRPIFLTLPIQERIAIRRAFRNALTSLHANWVTFTHPTIKLLLWDATRETVSFANLEGTRTFSRLGLCDDEVGDGGPWILPVRFRQWREEWYGEWGLGEEGGVIDGMSDGTVEPLEVARVTVNRRLEDMDRMYMDLVLREPYMAEINVESVLVGRGGEGIGVNEERREYMAQLRAFQGARMDFGGCVLL